MSTEIVVLALDAGKNDFAWSLCSDKRGVIRTGMLKHTIKSLSDHDIDENFILFRREFSKLVALALHYKTSLIVCERFQARPGGGMGAVGECVNSMIGVMGSFCLGRIKFRTVMATTWKSYFRRYYSADEIPALLGFAGLKKSTKSYPIQEHQMDSSAMGLYFVEKDQAKSKLKVFKASLKKIWKARIKKNPDAFKGARLLKIK